MITTVVFDLDDTLYDERDYCRSGFKAVAESLSNLVDVLSPSMNKSIVKSQAKWHKSQLSGNSRS